MTPTEYHIIAQSIRRTRGKLDPETPVGRIKLDAIALVAYDLSAALVADEPYLDRYAFLKDCGVVP